MPAARLVSVLRAATLCLACSFAVLLSPATAIAQDDAAAATQESPRPASEPPATVVSTPGVLVDPLHDIVAPKDPVRAPTPMKPLPEPPEPPAPEAFGSPAWNAPQLRPRDFDWVRLKNGEWLKGEIKDLRTDTFYFDSDEFDEVSLDWDKVESLRTASIYTLGFTGRREATGRVLLASDQVVVVTETGDKLVFARDDLYSIVPAATGFFSLWQGKIALGATVRSGNTDQIDVNSSANIKRQTAFTRFTFDGRANFGQVDGDTTVRNSRTNLTFDIFLTQRFFVTPLDVEFFQDELQNVDRRISPGAGLGYELVDRKRLTLNLQAGGVYRVSKSITTEPGQDDLTRSGAITAGTDWESDLTSRVEFDGSYNVSIGVVDISDTNHHASLVLSVEITKIFDLDLTFNWDHTGEPVATDDSVTPKKNDLELIAAIAINF